MLRSYLKAIWVLAAVVIAPRVVAFPVLSQTAPSCQADQVRLRVDDGHGYFDGMSQSGMFLILQNSSSSACTLPARPELSFQDMYHQTLPAAFRSPPGMHPGPVILPIKLLPHETVSSEVRWVSQDVYDPGRCVQPAYVAVAVDGKSIWTTFHGQLCGPQDKGPTYKATLLVPHNDVAGKGVSSKRS